MLNLPGNLSAKLNDSLVAPSVTPRTVEVSFRSGWLVGALALGVVLVIAGGVVGQLGPLRWPGLAWPPFSAATNLVGEFNIPATYNALLLLLVSLVLWWIGRLSAGQTYPPARVWTVLSGLAFYLTLDEYFTLHERLIGPLRRLLHLNGYLYYAWVVPYGLLALLLAISLGRFLLRLPSRTRNGMVLAGIVYVTGALGLEMLEAKIASLGDSAVMVVGHLQSAQLAMTELIALEEFMEMSALVLLIATLLHYVRHCIPGAALRLQLEGQKQVGAPIR